MLAVFFKLTMNITSIYIHTPFCRQKCRYCDFPSFAGKEYLTDEYFSCVIEEIKNSPHRGKKISTIFFGGGTPSLVHEKYIAMVLEELNKNFSIEPGCEITIETNPGTLTKTKLDSYHRSGINRISVGVQSHDDKVLKILGRIHSSEDVIRSVDMIRQAGFENYNLDIMCALPTQKLSDLEKSLEFAVRLEPTHISAYSLIIEEGTPFYDMKDSLDLPGEDEERMMYHLCKEYLSSYGYDRYEVSNYSKKGYECRHNLYCWQHEDYIGFGSAAHSFVLPQRWENTEDPYEYIGRIKENSSPAVFSEYLTAEELTEEYIMLSLRTTEGINVRKLQNKYGYDILSDKKREIDSLMKYGFIGMNKDNIFITTEGFDISDSITLKLI